MFKQIQSGFAKFFTKERILIISVFILLSWVLISYSGTKGMYNKEGFSVSDYLGGGDSGFQPTASSHSPPSSIQQQAAPIIPEQSAPVQKAPSVIQSVQPSLPSSSSSSFNSSSGSTASPFSQQAASPSDLLPKDENSQWAALNPSALSQGSALMPDLLQAGYHIGMDTIGQTLRNPNLQLRSDPIIQKQDIGPWNMSTIEADIGRVPLEIGLNN
jgi:hypothetical protein